MIAFSKFKESQLSLQEVFHSKLNDSARSLVKITIKRGGSGEIEKMGEYHDLYLKSDVLILADA